MILEKYLSDSESDNYPGEEGDSRKRQGSPTDHATQSRKRSRIAILEDRMESVLQIMCSKFYELKQPNTEFDGNRSEESHSDSELSDVESTYLDNRSERFSLWKNPELGKIPLPKQGKEFQINLESLSLAPQVKESEPLIPAPTLEINAQGIECQKLGTTNWNTIRYKDVQKKLHASPVFNSLKVNCQLEGLLQKSYSQTLLTRVGELTGTIIHGL